jgi:hypothetical protein
MSELEKRDAAYVALRTALTAAVEALHELDMLDRVVIGPWAYAPHVRKRLTLRRMLSTIPKGAEACPSTKSPSE